LASRSMSPVGGGVRGSETRVMELMASPSWGPQFFRLAQSHFQEKYNYINMLCANCVPSAGSTAISPWSRLTSITPTAKNE
jgi:hypothetical protein